MLACSPPVDLPFGPGGATETPTALPTATMVQPPPTVPPPPPTPEPAPEEEESEDTEEEAESDNAEEPPDEAEDSTSGADFVYSTEVRGLMAADSNFRVGPNLESEVIRQLQGGLPVYLQGRNGAATWVQIVPSDSEEVGWVAFSQIESVTDERAIALPIAQGQTIPDIPIGFSTNLDNLPTPVPPPSPEDDVSEEDSGDEDTLQASIDLPFGLEYGVDLIKNGSFEQPYQPWELLDGGGLVANQWEPWWYNDDGPIYDGPEYTMANISVDARRVMSGEDAQQYFRPCARHEAGVRQTISGLAPGLRFRFTVYGHAWSTDADDPNPEDSTDGGNTGDVIMKAGIDPTGGKDGRSDNIVWGEQKFAYDTHELFTVEAMSQADSITVFTYSSPNFPVCTNNVYWDDARLEVIP